MEKTEPWLVLEDVVKAFDDFRLGPLNWELFSGEVHMIIGENGSGKSTLMKLLAGWFSPTSGQIRIEGTPVSFKAIKDAYDRGIFYLHQEFQCFENLMVAENLFLGNLPALGRFSLFYNRNKILFKSREAFKELGITLNERSLIGELNYAERQLVSAVRGYLSPAKIVIFDEPSSVMSPAEREILFDIVRRLKEQGRIIIYISHRLDEISRIGDRVSVMDKGRLMVTQACETMDQNRLIRIMTGQVHKDRYPRLATIKKKIILSVNDLQYTPILKGINFDLREGEILGITGLMGSGRTLLANCLFGVVTPSGGSITIDGKEVRFLHPVEAMTEGISLIPEDRQKNGIFSRMDLLHNMTSASLERYRNLFFLDEAFMDEITRSYVDIMRINPGKSNDIIDQYSGGNQQKVMVSKWLMSRTKIYIMDEPTRGIDHASRLDIYNTMNDLTAKGAGIILISSEIEETLGMADRILVLSNGVIVSEMTREEATKERIIEAATSEI